MAGASRAAVFLTIRKENDMKKSPKNYQHPICPICRSRSMLPRKKYCSQQCQQEAKNRRNAETEGEGSPPPQEEAEGIAET